jgi:peroxiredoxin
MVSQVVHAQNAKGVIPKGPPPRFITVLKLDESKGEVMFDVQVVLQDARAQPEVLVFPSGEQRMTLDVKPRYVHLLEGIKVSLKKVKWAGVDDKEVTPAAAAKQLKPGVSVLLSADGHAVDQAFLRLFKDDTLVLIVSVDEAPVPYYPHVGGIIPEKKAVDRQGDEKPREEKQGPADKKQDQKKAEAGEPTPAERLKALVADYEAARQVYLKATNDGDGLKTPRDVYEKARQASEEATEKCAAGCLELAGKDPKDPAALDALLWVVRHRTASAPAHPKYGRQVPDHNRALELLRRDHLGSDKLGPFCKWLFPLGHAEDYRLLEDLLAHSPHRAVRAAALLSLAEYKLLFARTARLMAERPDAPQAFERKWGKDVVEALRKADPAKTETEGLGLLERLAKEYADVPDPLTGTLGRRAALQLDGLRRPPAVGQAAPAAQGADIAGKKLSLRDYRGKAVVLVFTSDSSSDLPYPQQRSLVKKFASRPLALLDVNVDFRERRKKINAKEQLTWPAIQDSTTSNEHQGPVATRWQVGQFPTLFLIDHKGVIREKYVGSPDEDVLARELEKLVLEAEAADKKQNQK